jgi:menaquinone-dependent protoporphyrinogen oxidase
MEMNVLVAYGSRHGSTAEIAERIGDRLRLAGLQAEVFDVSEQPDPAAYDAVVLGSAVYLGSWRREVASFAREHIAALATRPLWMFSSGPLAETSLEEPKPVAELRGVLQPRDHRIFQGELVKSRLSMPEKVVVAAIGSRMKKELAGDFRQWEEIDAWADGIARKLAATPLEVGSR